MGYKMFNYTWTWLVPKFGEGAYLKSKSMIILSKYKISHLPNLKNSQIPFDLNTIYIAYE